MQVTDEPGDLGKPLKDTADIISENERGVKVCQDRDEVILETDAFDVFGSRIVLNWVDAEALSELLHANAMKARDW